MTRTNERGGKRDEGPYSGPSSPASPAGAVRSLGENVAQHGVVLVFIDVMNADMPTMAVVSRGLCMGSRGYLGDQTHLCRLSGLGYLCSRSGQKGHTYPGESWTKPCRIISFLRLNPLPPSLLGHPLTGQ